MKITFVNPSVGTTFGGSESLIHNMANSLSFNNQVTVLTGKSSHIRFRDEIKESDYRVSTIPFSPRFTPLNNILSRIFPRLDPYKTESLTFHFNARMSQQARKIISNSDVISMHYRLDSRLFSNFAKKLKTASVFHILGTLYGPAFFEKDCSTLYVATTNYEAKILKKQGADIYSVISPGVPYVLNDGSNPDFSSRNGLLFVARMQKTKGIDELLSIMSEIKGQTLTVIGTGPDLGYFKQKAKTMGVENKIRFLGALPPERVYEHMKISKILIFPSHSETFGIVPLEAMAMGLPVICTNLPTMKEATGGYARQIPLNDTESWIDNISLLTNEKKVWDDSSKSGIRWAKDKTWANKAKQYEKCLKEAVNRFY